ncbi:hypothetical protein D3C72_1398910 [compost metagenome]
MPVNHRDQRTRQTRRIDLRSRRQNSGHLVHNDLGQPSAPLVLFIRQDQIRRQVMIIDRRPAVRIGAREAEIGLDQRPDSIRPAPLQRLPDILGPKLEGPRIDGDQQLIQGAEDIIQGADRVADPLGHLSRGKAREADLGHVLVALDHKQVLQLLPRMIRTSAHRPCIAESRFGKAEETSVFRFY